MELQMNDFNLANDPQTDCAILEELAKHQDEHIRASIALNTNANDNTLLSLVGDGSEYVRENLLLNSKQFNTKNFTIQYSQHIKLKLVDIIDAEFILSLRVDENLNKHLSRVENNLENQIEWIKHYKIREKARLEFYFIIQSLTNENLGAVRIYDFEANSFCWGSWMIKRDAPNIASIESALSVYEFAFNKLGFEKSHFDVRKENEKVLNFHKRFGAKIVSEDELNYYFEFQKETYYKTKEKYKKFLL
jgi:RimJ/RimL family protein N-acetyltransferase